MESVDERTSTLALFRDFHDDNRPAQDPQGETSKKTGGKERMTEVAQGVAEGSEGMCTTNLFLWGGEWEIDLGNPARSRGPAVPRFLRSNLLDDFFFGVRSATSHLAPPF